MFQRIKRMWALSNKDPAYIEKAINLTKEEVAELPDVGDGKAVFIGEGSADEFADYEKEKKGIKGLFGL